MEKAILLLMLSIPHFVLAKYMLKQGITYEQKEKNSKFRITILAICILSLIVTIILFRKGRIFCSIVIAIYFFSLLREKENLKKIKANIKNLKDYSQKIRLKKLEKERPEDIIDVEIRVLD